MKNIIITTCILIFSLNLFGQTEKLLDLNSGKHYSFEKKANFRHNWSNPSDKSKLSLSIDFKKKDYKKSSNVSVDVFVISIKRCFHNGVDISSSFINPIEIPAISPNDKLYKGILIDPITRNSIYAYIEYIDDKNIQFYASVAPWPENDPKKGTVLPENPVVLSRGL